MRVQVVWLGRPVTESSWEPKPSLPKELVEDFEQGIEYEEVFTSGGQSVHTISTKRCDYKTEEPPQKKLRHVPSSTESSNKGRTKMNNMKQCFFHAEYLRFSHLSHCQN